jgi:hypothetical protein
MSKINITRVGNLIQFNESTGSVFIIRAEALAGARVYTYKDYGTGEMMHALKLFFTLEDQEPIVYNGYATKVDAIFEFNKVITLMGEGK